MQCVKWLYTQVVVPALAYGSLGWAHVPSRNEGRLSKLNHVQRSALLMITGAINSSPLTSLECIVGCPPLDLRIKLQAMKTAFRLKAEGHWIFGYHGGKIRSHAPEIDIWLKDCVPVNSVSDFSVKAVNISQPFSVQIDSRASVPPLITALHYSLEPGPSDGFH